MSKNLKLLEDEKKVLEYQANNKKEFFDNIVELHPLLDEFFRFINDQHSKQLLKDLIKICNEYDVGSLRELCISFE